MKIGAMKIGTWNLAGRWDARHEALLDAQDCDVWLLTEVNERVQLPGYFIHRTAGPMRRRVAWAGVLSRAALRPLPDPHPASAAAETGGTTFCSSILPWRSCGGAPPWRGDTHARRTEAAVDDLRALVPTRPMVWGGDWNHALSGREFSGSAAGRRAILGAVAARGFAVPTEHLPHRIEGLLSIDHIALPHDVCAVAHRVRAVADGVRLSDHDMYVAVLR